MCHSHTKRTCRLAAKRSFSCISTNEHLYTIATQGLRYLKVLTYCTKTFSCKILVISRVALLLALLPCYLVVFTPHFNYLSLFPLSFLSCLVLIKAPLVESLLSFIHMVLNLRILLLLHYHICDLPILTNRATLEENQFSLGIKHPISNISTEHFPQTRED